MAIAAGYGNSKFVDDAQIAEETRALNEKLRDSNTRTKLEGLKQLIAMMSTGRDVSHFFPSVVVNIVTESFEVKALVYMFLVRTAEQKPDEALLSINSFQKDLAHQNARVRAAALRVMSSIRVKVIVPVVVLAIRKCAVDVSPHVRKAAAHAIPKIFRLDPSRADDFVEVIETMLRDSTPFVLSSAIAAFQEVCPHRIDLLHRHYRKLARILVDIDEWGQMLTCELLLRYARTQFLPPDGFNRELNVGKDNESNEEMLDIAGFNDVDGNGGGASGYDRHDTGGTKGILAQAANFYDDDEEDSDDDSSSSSDSDDSNSRKKKTTTKASKKRGPVNQGPEFLDDDHRLLLRCTRPLLQSQNAGVVLAVASLHFYLAPIADVPRATRALVFAARTKPECQHVLLKNAVAMAAVQPRCFRSHFEAFFVHPGDHMDVRALKLEMLTYIVTAENAPSLLRELQAYLRSSSQEFVALTIRAVGRCAAIMPQIASICIRSLLELSLHPSETVAGEAVVVIRALVQKAPKEHASVVATLVRRLDHLLAPAARSAVVWLAGGELFLDQQQKASSAEAGASSSAVTVVADGGKEYKKLGQMDASWNRNFFDLALAVVTKAMARFPDEHESTRQQILHATCKMYVRYPIETEPLLRHCLNMASKDPSVDIRDRARIYGAIFAKTDSLDDEKKDAYPRLKKLLSEKLLFCDKPITRLPSPAPPTCPHQLGSLSQFVEHVANGYAGLPKHPREAPPSSVRDRTYDTGGIGGGTTTSKSKKSNRGFYSSSDEDSSDEDASDDDSSDDDFDDSDDSDDSSDSDDSDDSDSDESSSYDSSSESSESSGSDDDDEKVEKEEKKEEAVETKKKVAEKKEPETATTIEEQKPAAEEEDETKKSEEMD
ncbi:unnamed protein product [Bathycoccus prasinos]